VGRGAWASHGCPLCQQGVSPRLSCAGKQPWDVAAEGQHWLKAEERGGGLQGARERFLATEQGMDDAQDTMCRQVLAL